MCSRICRCWAVARPAAARRASSARRRAAACRPRCRRSRPTSNASSTTTASRRNLNISSHSLPHVSRHSYCCCCCCCRCCLSLITHYLLARARRNSKRRLYHRTLSAQQRKESLHQYPAVRTNSCRAGSGRGLGRLRLCQCKLHVWYDRSANHLSSSLSLPLSLLLQLTLCFV
jgi:hypothetical protein